MYDVLVSRGWIPQPERIVNCDILYGFSHEDESQYLYFDLRGRSPATNMAYVSYYYKDITNNQVKKEIRETYEFLKLKYGI